MHNHFDQLAKQIGQIVLGPSGATATQVEITADAQYADLRHEPDPTRTRERERLGLLGRLVSQPCLIEVYSQSPSAEDFRACLAKHFIAWRARDASMGDPFLWIISSGVPTTLIDELELAPAPEWPRGVYLFGDNVLRIGIVVASQLPRERSSLLIRLMAGGRSVATAVSEVAALPRDAFERAATGPILLQFQRRLGLEPDRAPDEEDFFMEMLKSWDDFKDDGIVIGTAQAVLTVLDARGIATPGVARDRILAEQDLERLKRWLKRAAIAPTIEAVLD